MLLKQNIQRLHGEYYPNFMEITSKKYPITENNICVGNVPFVLNVHEVRSSSDFIIDFEQKFVTTGYLVLLRIFEN